MATFGNSSLIRMKTLKKQRGNESNKWGNGGIEINERKNERCFSRNANIIGDNNKKLIKLNFECIVELIYCNKLKFLWKRWHCCLY